MKAYQDPPEFRDQTQMALPRMTPAVKWLLWINVGFFVLFLQTGDTGLRADLFETLALSPSQWVRWKPFVPVWQLLSYGFLHSQGDAFHILFNMLSLYFFGTLLEGLVGTSRFLWTYLTSIVLGGVFQLGAGLWELHSQINAPQPFAVPITIGASGGIMCLIVAAAVLRPHMTVIFILFPLKLRTLALIMVGLDLFGFVRGGGGTAYLVHLTGASYGFLAARLGWLWFEPRVAWAARRARRMRSSQQDDKERLDLLLKQIHERGIGSLSRGEKRFLKRVSGRP